MKKEEIQEKIARSLKAGREFVERAEKDKRLMNAEEQKGYDAAMKDVLDAKETLQRMEHLEKQEREFGATATGKPVRIEPGSDLSKAERNEKRDMAEARKQAINRYVRGEKLKRKEVELFAATPEERAAFVHYLRTGRVTERSLQPTAEMAAEYRDTQLGIADQGGFIVTPQEFTAKVILKLKDLVFIRGLAQVLPLYKAESLGAPALDTEPDDPTWTTELATGSLEAGMRFGKRELHPHPLAIRIKFSNKLLRAEAIDVEGLVLDRIAYKLARVEENAFLNGSGAQQPLGLFTASTSGVSTARDVNTGNTTTAIQPDNLLEVKYSIKGQYWKNLRWMFHRNAVKQIAKLKDGNGRYLWDPLANSGMHKDTPNVLLGFPFDMSELAPSTFTTGLYVGALYDPSFYWIADSLNMTVQRLVELYAEANETGYIVRKETDGMPVVEEAFARVTLA